MVKVAQFVRLQAKPGKEEGVKEFLESAAALANRKASTPVWFALRLGSATFAIFDAFEGDCERQAHLPGDIAKTLMAEAPRLLSEAPDINRGRCAGGETAIRLIRADDGLLAPAAAGVAITSYRRRLN